MILQNLFTKIAKHQLWAAATLVPALADTLSHVPVANNINTLFRVPVAAPVATTATANTHTHVPVADIDTPADANTLDQNIGTTAKKLRKRKLDDVDLILPDGSRRIRKKKCRPDESIPLSTKRAKKK